MRIGLVTGEYPPMQGGVGAYSHILGQELVRQGHSVFVFSTNQAADTGAAIILENRIRTWGPVSLRAVVSWAEHRQLDVVVLQYQTAAYQMSPWVHFLPSVMRHRPVVTTFHDLRYPFLFPKAGRLRDWIVMWLARTSDGVIVTNHEDLQRVQPLGNVRLIPIGSNILTGLPSGFDPQSWRAKASAGNEDFLLAYFGLINRNKGLDVLLESIAKLRSEYIPARLLIIGAVGTSDPTNVIYANEIEAMIQERGLMPYVSRVGYLQDDGAIGSFLAASDAVVLPFVDGASYRRGSLMAAIRYACPIVTTAPRVQIPTFVDGENLRLVEAGNSASLASALRELYRSPALRQRLRQGAAKLARHFDWPQIVSDYTNFLSRVIEAHA
jgi:glycosyltransferase involved in cell wall biosynthesis